MPTRRRYLGLLGLAGIGTLAGCTGDGGDGGGGDGGGGGGNGSPVAASPDGNVSATRSLDLPIAKSELSRGAAKDAIPAIVDPAFGEDWSGVRIESSRFADGVSKPRLSPDDQVIGVERGGEARAYPLKVLNWHEIVNDTFDGPLLVTYCPLCGSALTAARRVGGAETTFGVSGYLYRNDLVMYDEKTNSLWSQIAATAINGPKTGTTLELVPSTLTTWGEWQGTHPDTVVLRPPPESDTVTGRAVRDYSQNPYAGYEVSSAIGLGGSYEDDRLHPKTTVIGVGTDGEATAYPFPVVLDEGVVNDRVGGVPVVVAATADGTLVAYARTVDGEVLSFERADEGHLRAGGSRWAVATGRAVDGPHEGTTLQQANDASPMFFFAWKDFHPDTAVYGVEGRDGTVTPAG